MGVIMQIMIIALHIDIRPALKNPFKIIADTGFAGVIEYRPVTALPQPDKRRVICNKDIVRRIINRHIIILDILCQYKIGQYRVCRLIAGQS